MIDPVKLYVGNVPGPIGVTSAAAVLIGVTYLWYTRKISLGIVAGFLIGIIAGSLILRTDAGFQLASGPALFIAGYIAADRRRVALNEQFTIVFGLAAGLVTMALRWYGEGLQSTWQAFLLVSVAVTVVLRVQMYLRRRTSSRMRTLDIESGDREPRAVVAPIPAPAPQPVMAAARVSTGYRGASMPTTTRRFDTSHDPNDLVRQMRNAATRGSSWGTNQAILLASLLVVNPVGLWLTWKTRSMAQQVKLMLTGASVLWYLGAAGLAFALLHR